MTTAHDAVRLSRLCLCKSITLGGEVEYEAGRRLANSILSRPGVDERARQPVTSDIGALDRLGPKSRESTTR